MAPELVVVDITRTAPKPRLPLRRLSENFFQRWYLILIPLVLMTLIGVLLSQRVQPSYSADATMSASANPLLVPLTIRGTEQNFLESPADVTARVINERLGTDRFAASVAERVGLAEAIENELVTYDDIREAVTVFALGDSLVNIEVSWGDPETSVLLVDATIEEHLSVLRSTVSQDAQSAVDFFDSRLQEAIEAERLAADALDTYIAGLPELRVGEDEAVADQLALQRLNGRLEATLGAIDDAEEAIEEARLSVVQAESDAGRSLQIIDAATSTFQPESTLPQQAVIVFVFFALGSLVALTILLLSTHLDRSVRSAGDIEAAGGGLTVAAVPVIKALRGPKTHQRALGAARRAG